MSADTNKNSSGQILLDVLDLRQIEQNLYLGQNEQRQPQRLFGGQVLAQAARAAYATVKDVHLHSLHGYFLRAGSPQRPVLYEIERIRDGRSFVTRRVVAVQNGEAIFNMDVSFQIEEVGFDHALSMPNVPLPDELKDDVEVAKALGDDERLSPLARIERPFETRSVFQLGSEAWGGDRRWSPVWVRFRKTVEDDVLARCLLAYVSDMGMVSTASLPHQTELKHNHLQMASLDHALWIHRHIDMNQWLLFHKRTSTSQGSRGMVHADIYAQGGTLLASVTQEGLLRVAKNK
jgi:acyl-CoA thioesterase-2